MNIKDEATNVYLETHRIYEDIFLKEEKRTQIVNKQLEDCKPVIDQKEHELNRYIQLFKKAQKDKENLHKIIQVYKINIQQT